MSKIASLKKDKWRIILQPLDENEDIFDPIRTVDPLLAKQVL